MHKEETALILFIVHWEGGEPAIGNRNLSIPGGYAAALTGGDLGKEADLSNMPASKRLEDTLAPRQALSGSRTRANRLTPRVLVQVEWAHFCQKN